MPADFEGYAQRFLAITPATSSHLPNDQSRRDEPQVRPILPPLLPRSPFSLKRLRARATHSFINFVDRRTNPHISSHVVQEALRQDSALRHCGCRRPRVHHPHAQASTLLRQRIARETELEVSGINADEQKLHGVTFKKRAPRAIKEIKAFATKSMVRLSVPRA